MLNMNSIFCLFDFQHSLEVRYYHRIMSFSNIEQRDVIKFLQKKGSSPKEIYDCIVILRGQDVANYSTVMRCCKDFKRDRDTIEDALRSGMLVDTVIDNSIPAVEKLIMDDRRIKITEIESELNMSIGSIESIIHGYFGMTKVSARWVPRNLAHESQLAQKRSSQKVLFLYEDNPENFLSRLVTGYEMCFITGTWILKSNHND